MIKTNLTKISSHETWYPDEQPTPTSNLFELAEGGVTRQRDYCIDFASDGNPPSLTT